MPRPSRQFFRSCQPSSKQGPAVIPHTSTEESTKCQFVTEKKTTCWMDRQVMKRPVLLAKRRFLRQRIPRYNQTGARKLKETHQSGEKKDDGNNNTMVPPNASRTSGSRKLALHQLAPDIFRDSTNSPSDKKTPRGG